jgi:hypothetical protein
VLAGQCKRGWAKHKHDPSKAKGDFETPDYVIQLLYTQVR